MKWCHLEYLELLRSISFKKSWLNLSSSAYLLDHRKSKGIREKTSTSASLTMLKPVTVWITTNSEKFLKEMRIPDNLTCLLIYLYSGQEATVTTGRGTTDWFKIWKGVHQGCILSPCLFNLYAEYIMRNAELDKAQAGIKIAGRNINNSDTQMTTPLWQKVKN